MKCFFYHLRLVFGLIKPVQHDLPQVSDQRKEQLARSERRIASASAGHTRAAQAAMLSNMRTEQRTSAIATTIKDVVDRMADDEK